MIPESIDHGIRIRGPYQIVPSVVLHGVPVIGTGDMKPSRFVAIADQTPMQNVLAFVDVDHAQYLIEKLNGL